MAGYSGRERAYRTRNREDMPKDAITSALTAQVLLCLVLAVCMLLMKKFNNEDYFEIKRQYAVMLSDSSQTSELVKKISGENSGISSFFSGFDKILNGFAPDISREAVTEPEAEPDGSADEPADGEVESEAFARPDFDYLKDGASLAYIVPTGGLLPIEETGTDGMLPAPKGSTLSPVYLSASMRPPVTGLITSGFSYRLHPLTGDSDFHTGLDIAAVEGTPILAALPGEVTEIGFSEIYGSYIVLQHATNLKTSYSHCSGILAQEGMAVRQGERIALVGDTGAATGPHLHFSVIVEDEFTDPTWVLSDYIKLVDE